MNGMFRVRHRANESLHHAREVQGGIEVNLNRGKDSHVVLDKDYFFMVLEVEEQLEQRERDRKQHRPNAKCVTL
jgi:hypothetical protein